MTTIYNISGIDRRNLKKELSKLKKRKAMFWFCESVDEDLTNQNTNNNKDNEIVNNRYNEILLEIIELENKLSEKL
jgi:hypothetical protein